MQVKQQLKRSQRLVSDLKRGSVSMAQLQAMPEAEASMASQMHDHRIEETEECVSTDQAGFLGFFLHVLVAEKPSCNLLVSGSGYCEEGLVHMLGVRGSVSADGRVPCPGLCHWL